MLNKKSKKRLSLLFLCFSAMLYCPHPAWIDGDILSPSSKITNLTLKRHCIVSRLSPTLKAIENFYKQSPNALHALYQNALSTTYNHALFRELQLEIQLTKSLYPFFDFYLKYQQYHAIEEDTLNKQLLIFITHAINFLNKELTAQNKKPLNIKPLDHEKLLAASVSEIVFRFYFLKRIESILKEKRYCLKSVKRKSIHSDQFDHPCIRNCIQEMQVKKTTHSFMKLYRDIESYNFLDDLLLIQEFLIVLTLLYESDSTEKKIDVDQLKQLPIKELLDYINALELNLPFSHLFKHAKEISQKYEARTIKTTIESEFALTENQFCSLVLRRYYLINRFSDVDHQFISQKISTLTLQTSVRPLLVEWKKFKRYFFLNDQLSIDEVGEELFLVAAPEDIPFCQDSVERTHSLQTEPSGPLSDVKPFIGIDEIVLRWYHIKRLQNAFIKISLFENEKTLFKTPKPILNHSVTQKCLKAICRIDSVKPFVELTKRFNSYYYIADELFLKEFLILSTYCKKNLLENLHHRVGIKKKNYNHMSVNEILDEIDKLTEKIAAAEERQKQLSWKNYLQHFWLLKKLQKLYSFFI